MFLLLMKWNNLPKPCECCQLCVSKPKNSNRNKQASLDELYIQEKEIKKPSLPIIEK